MARHALALGSRTLRRFAGASRRRGAATDAFSDLEHEMWQRGATAYDAGFGPLTSQAAPTLVDAALGGLDATRATLLDVATRVVTSLKASRSCSQHGSSVGTQC